MPKNKVFMVIGVIVLVLLVYLGFKYYGGSGKYSNRTSAPATVNVSGNAVSIQSNSFSPDTLNVKVGTKVTWTNNDSYDHTITEDNGVFDSGHIASGQSYSFTFTNAGTFSYHCAVHPFMTAKIVVAK